MPTTPKLAAVPLERARFHLLIGANPNWFGTEPKSPYPVVKALARQTTYEELKCVGLQPETSQLEAVVYLKQSAGYSGSLCGGGSTEFVRFYVSYDSGATWQDEGLAQFAAHDLAGPKPLEYAVTRPVALNAKLCSTENLVRVRAILSWGVAPTPATPSFAPVWGNVVDATVQVAPRRRWPWGSFVDAAKLALPVEIAASVSGSQDVVLEPGPELGVAELSKLYARSKVAPHRYLFKEATSLAASSATSAAKDGAVQTLVAKSAGAKPEALAESSLVALKFDPGKLIDAIVKTSGDTDYEQLTCLGYDPNNDALVGIVNVKLSSGYSGGLCTAGSREYVAFWVDWNDGGGWQYAGTSSFASHDLATMPAGGLEYGVFEVINAAARRRPCAAGPVYAKVRAILSWQAAPPPGDPNWVPTWGNRLETQICLTPLAAADYRPILESISGVPVCNIDQSTGRTANTYDQPFGGAITVTGFIPTAPDISTPLADLLRYRVLVKRQGALAWEPVTSSFTISVIERIGAGLPTQYPILQEIGADGFFIYREDMNSSGAGWRLVQNRVLASWITGAPMAGRYDIRVEAKDPVTGILYGGQSVLCTDGTTRTTVTIELDETGPDCGLALTGYRRGAGPLQPAANCDTLKVGDTLVGSYHVTDDHTGGFTLTVEPAAPAHGAAVSPSARSYPVIPTAGEAGTWSLNTTGMDPCGYIIRLWSWDRTIVSGDGSGWKCADSIGFCLNK